ncbi:MAG TPA: hypothetical protein VNQ52_01495 [Microbacteriaceae bacterium]|nr:hypothetical protein [Microbacteriaceae bacterium]
MTEPRDPLAEPMPQDPAELRAWATDVAAELLVLRDRVVGAEAAAERARAELESARAGDAEHSGRADALLAKERQWEVERDRLTAEVATLQAGIDSVTGTRLWRIGRRLRAPLRAMRLWR